MLTAVLILAVLNLVTSVIAIWQRQQTIRAMKEERNELAGFGLGQGGNGRLTQ